MLSMFVLLSFLSQCHFGGMGYMIKLCSILPKKNNLNGLLTIVMRLLA